MAAKTVTIESKDYVFNTLKEAQKYYDAVVKELFDATLTLTKGQDFEDLKWIYSAYCGYTKHNLDKLSEYDIIGVKGIRTIREKSGQYVPTECCSIVFSDGSEEEFYTDKAIKEIAIKQNPR
ncbi:hypothetical protein [Psychrobacter sp. AOP7-A1-24]|uniref:hypothetical protein n=1 Tax=Psychrobacter sp. AOP7-A1-24 TaxID=3457646 RepID=UPI00402BA0D0